MIYIIILETGKENNTTSSGDAQFKIRVNVKNNIYSTASNDQIKTFNYYSNGNPPASIMGLEWW